MTQIPTLCETVAAAVRNVEGVTSARPWTSVPGKERVYISLQSFNGRFGYADWYWDANSDLLYVPKKCGARTRNWHEENGTKEKIFAAIQAARKIFDEGRTSAEDDEEE